MRQLREFARLREHPTQRPTTASRCGPEPRCSPVCCVTRICIAYIMRSSVTQIGILLPCARAPARLPEPARHAPVTVNPDDGSLGFSFSAAREEQDLDATIERLLQLPGQLGAERGRRVVLVFDEFQEIADLDPHLLKL